MKAITANKGYNEYVTHFTGVSGHASNPKMVLVLSNMQLNIVTNY